MPVDSALAWFRRDLRVADNAALYHALRAAQRVHCVFVFDTTILDPLNTAGPAADRRVEFIRRAVAELDQRGVHRAFVTLHVGAGTFQPVRTDAVGAHVMHAEFVEVSAAACDAVAAARARGARVIAVGTTVVRALESAAGSGELAPYVGDSSLFIVPGFRFRVVDAMLTNFHLPESTLLMLVSAFAGREAVLSAYRHAVAGQYRFFSYGDAMFLTPSR